MKGILVKQFLEKLKDPNNSIVVLMSNKRCKHCDTAREILSKIAGGNTTFEFFEIEIITDKEDPIANMYSLEVLPTVIVFHGDVVVCMINGLVKEETYRQLLGVV